MNFDNPAMRMTHADYLAHEARLKAKTVQSGDGVEVESKLHEQIIAECKHRGWYFVRARMDCATTQAKGTPDFIIATDYGKTFWIECKTAKGKLTTEQAGTLRWLEHLGHTAATVRSLNDFFKLVIPT